MEEVGIFYGHLVYFTVNWYIYGHLLYFVAIWHILWPFGIFYGRLVYIFCGHLVYFTDKWYIYFVVIWYILRPTGIFCGLLLQFPRFGKLYQEKSGNPGRESRMLFLG
jgi:hypothetical protein